MYFQQYLHGLRQQVHKGDAEHQPSCQALHAMHTNAVRRAFPSSRASDGSAVVCVLPQVRMSVIEFLMTCQTADLGRQNCVCVHTRWKSIRSEFGLPAGGPASGSSCQAVQTTGVRSASESAG